MILPPNEVFDLYRAVQDDGYGDTEDDDSGPLYAGIRGVLSYKTRTVMDPVTRTPQQVAFYFCLFPQGSDVRNDDRLRARSTGDWFNVSGTNPLPSYGFPNDVSISLTKAGG